MTEETVLLGLLLYDGLGLLVAAEEAVLLGRLLNDNRLGLVTGEERHIDV